MRIQQSGFNLIELSICMIIMIILSTQFYYGYQYHRHHLERKQAELCLEDMVLHVEELKDPQAGYANLLLENLSCVCPKNNYTYNLISDTTHFLITATPLFEDPCGILSINEAGAHENKGTLQDCWS